jgi:serine/threonine protein kinase
MKEFRIVNCDLKPENIMLKKHNKAQIKLIDYGSGCYEPD